MELLDPRALRMVLAIAGAGTVTAAAASLHLTQPALSQALGQLERRLGVKLFHRARKRMSATPAGRRLIEGAPALLAELARLEATVTGRAHGSVEVVRLTTECYTCYHWLPAVLAALRERAPDVRVELVPEVTREPLSALLDGRVDLAIVHSEVRDRHLVQTPLFRDELVAVVAPGHRLAARRSLSPRDLAREHLLLHVERDHSTVVVDFLRPAGHEPAHVSPLVLTEAVLESARAGLGVAVVARWVAAPMLRTGALRAVPLGRSGLVRQWFATRRTEQGRSGEPDLIAELIELLRRSELAVGGRPG
jgi:LysR family transcriptional regulator for metE and metH